MLEDNDLPEVELQPAFRYSCEECGRLNYVDPVAIEDPERQALYQEIMSAAFEDDIEGEWDSEVLMVPDRVHCKWCGASFMVAPDIEFEDEDDE